MAHEEDAALLVEMLDIVGNGIDRILHSQPGLFLVRFRPLIKRAIEGEEGKERKDAPWPHAQRLIRQAQETLRDPTFNWRYVEEVGLVGGRLQWEKDVLATEAQAGLGTIGRFLKIADSFLGSLMKALPLLEPVKELKEIVEACIAHLNRKMP